VVDLQGKGLFDIQGYLSDENRLTCDDIRWYIIASAADRE
jgi:hypothetical protein